MNEVDNFLSRLKAEYEHKQKNTQQKINNQQSNISNKFKSFEQDSSSRMDNLLEQVKSQYQNKNQQSSSHSSDNVLEKIKSQYKNQNKQNHSKSQATEDILANVKAEFDRKKARSQQPEKKMSSSSDRTKLKVRENLIEQLRSDYQTKQKAARENRDINNLAEIQQQELQRQRRRKALTYQAQQWLKNLDLRSDEGLWFEEFSYAYESKLVAAIDYLEALQESGFKE